MKRETILAAASLLAAALFAAPARAQLAQSSSVADACGARATGGAYNHISAGGQPGGVAESWGGPYVHQAGFLQTFLLRPGLDSDADGLPDEADRDNDGDHLTDAVELLGTEFDPRTVTDPCRGDTDGDGVCDGEESVAGTDPTDPDAHFRVLSIQREATGQSLSWLARGHHDRAYVVIARATPFDSGGAVLFSNTVAGGTPPWYVVTNVVIDATPVAAEFYHVITSK